MPHAATAHPSESQTYESASDVAALAAAHPDTAASVGTGALLRAAHRQYTKALQYRLADHGMPIGLWYFLAALAEKDGVSQRALSRRVGTVEPAAVSVLGQMEKRGWIVRDRDPQDQRRRVVFLTDEGRGVHDRLQPVLERLDDARTHGLSREQAATLQSLLGTMARSIERSLERGAL